MKILLVGEYSSLHWTLAEGLRLLGHDVTVASDGDGFKNYKRDIDLKRKSSSIKHTAETVFAVLKNLSDFKGYDVVQLINPCFTQLSVGINRRLFHFLKKNNRKVFLGAFGDDSFWLRACSNNKTFRYSEFYIDGKEHHMPDNERLKGLWLNSDREALNQEIADSCDGIIACLYEYFAAYKELPQYNSKLTYIPLPINLDKIECRKLDEPDKVKFFIGINKDRSEFKGTDRMLSVLTEVCNQYKNESEFVIAESVQYADYMEMMRNADVVLDQLYSYSPAMNGLLALAMGKILVGGGEPEMYDLLPEAANRPIVNVCPSENDIYNKLEYIVKNKFHIPKYSENGRLFVEKHHEYVKVAQQYLDFWQSKGGNK